MQVSLGEVNVGNVLTVIGMMAIGGAAFAPLVFLPPHKKKHYLPCVIVGFYIVVLSYLYYMLEGDWTFYFLGVGGVLAGLNALAVMRICPRCGEIIGRHQVDTHCQQKSK